MSIQVRYFLPTDREAIIELTRRLSEFDLPEWRHSDQIDNTNIAMINQAIDESDPDNIILVAEDESQGIVGYIRLQTQIDYFSGEKHGYIANIAVDKVFEGLGIGRRLLATAEKWSQEKGYDKLKLHVFAENKRAQQVYEKNGFHPDILTYIKVITPHPKDHSKVEEKK